MTTIGEIRSGRELGYKSRFLRVWVECPSCHISRWIRLITTKEPDYTSYCHICWAKQRKYGSLPYRETVVAPQLGDMCLTHRSIGRGTSIFIACPDCGKGHWCGYYDSIKGIRSRCFPCGQKIAHAKLRKSNEQKFPTRLSNAIRANIRDALHRKGGDKKERGWESLVGYTIKDLIKHLQKQFTGGMTWNNYGKWHIDHIIPVSAFNFTSTDGFDFKRCWALSNLQPLWAKENMSKHTDILKPFQPSLKIS